MMTGLGYLKLFGYYLRRHEDYHWSEGSEIPPVGGLGFIGYLGMMSATLYGDLGPTFANIMIGVMSALVAACFRSAPPPVLP